MKNAISFILIAFCFLYSSAQIKKEKLHTIGIGITAGIPFKIAGHQPYEKYSLQFRKCVGFGIMKINANYVKNPHDPWHTENLRVGKVLTDSTVSQYSYSQSAYRTDIRIGFDKDVGGQDLRILIGLDAIAGMMRRRNTIADSYVLKTWMSSDSKWHPAELNGAYEYYEINYLKMGFDVTIGFEFQLSENFNLTAQWSPEWNHYKQLTEIDESVLYLHNVQSESWADINLFFDVFLSYKF
ncbi:MAG: hypothetical protein ACI9J3_004153 [Parvicellaceae bacterium]|jgi:hypothetical protein